MAKRGVEATSPSRTNNLAKALHDAKTGESFIKREDFMSLLSQIRGKGPLLILRSAGLTLLLFFMAGLLSCQSTMKPGENGIGIPDDQVGQQESEAEKYPLDKEGWINRDVFQVIESIPADSQDLSSAQRKEAKRKAVYRGAEIIALKRYNLYKKDFHYIKKLTKFRPFLELSRGKLVYTSYKDDQVRLVYRLNQKNLQRKMKQVLNSFEEHYPELRKKIRPGDYSY